MDSHPRSFSPLRLRRFGVLNLALVLIALAAVPAAADAQPSNNHYLQSFPVNSPGSTLPASIGFTQNITGATTQGDIFNPPSSGGPAENLGCQRQGFPVVNFDTTVWFDIYPHRPGNLTVVAQSASFTVMVAVMKFDLNTALPDLNTYRCAPASGLGAVVLNYPFRLEEGAGYTIQVGKVTGAGTAGNYDIDFFFDPDTDRDGLVDSADECPTAGGTGAHRGCPDADGDGIRDKDDACPSQSGPAQHSGCPDSDGDGLADRNDQCPTAGGTGAFGGCPDADGDNIPENGRDECPGLNPRRVDRNDKNRDGCPDILRNDRQVGVRMDVGGLSTGILMRSFVVTGVPKGARVEVKCNLPGGKRCGGVRIRRAATASVLAKAARRVTVKSLRNKRLPFGTQITVRVTARYATGKFVRLKVVNTASRVSRRDFCMRPGSRKLRKKGCA